MWGMISVSAPSQSISSTSHSGSSLPCTTSAPSLWPSNRYADPIFAETTDVYVEKSQAGFKSPSTMEVMMVLMAFAAGFGLVVLAFKFGGAGGNGITHTIGMNLAGVLV